MKKLAGLFVFIVVVVGAIALTRYYTASPPAPPQPPPAAPPQQPAATGGMAATTPAPVTFKVLLAALDFAESKGHTTLELEADPSRPAPEKVWVWVYFFPSEARGERRYCAGEPVEVRQPFGGRGHSMTVSVPVKIPDCPAPSSPSATYYARVNVSTESAFAARLSEGRISYDITQATPAVVQGVRPARR